MLADSTAQNDHAGFLGLDAQVVEPANVTDQIDDQAWILVRVEIEHITQAAVRQGRTKDGNAVLQG